MDTKRSVIAATLLCVSAASLQAGVYLYVSNAGTNTLTAYDAVTGASLGTAVNGGPEIGGLGGVRVANNSIYLVGSGSNNVIRYLPNGSLVGALDPANAAGLNSPQGLTFGPDGKLYVVSSSGDKIARFDPTTGQFLGNFADTSVNGHAGPIAAAFANGMLFVSTFDSGELMRFNGTSGAYLGSASAGAGVALGDLVLGPDGYLYADALDPSTFLGGIARFNAMTGAYLGMFIPNGTAGLNSPAGLAIDPNGNLLVANLIFDPMTLADTGSTVLRFNLNGQFAGTLVGAGRGIDTPFFMTVASTPEPATWVLMAGGAALIALRRRVC